MSRRLLHPDLLAGIVRHLERFGPIDHTKRSRLAHAKRWGRDLIGRCRLPNNHRALVAYLEHHLRNNAIRERSRQQCKRPLFESELAERAQQRAEDRYLRATIRRLQARGATRG